MLLRIERDLIALGGVASTAELLCRGHEPELIRIWARYGRIIRVRKGWYASRDESAEVIEALRIGGKLACVSAAIHHGLVPAGVETLHVSVDRHSSRLRTRESARLRLAQNPDSSTVIHWSRSALEGDRRAVSAHEALRQMRTCDRDEVREAIRDVAANR